MSKENFSIIIPVYNAEKTIEECIKNILRLKDKNDEIIVVDNNSTDNSNKIIMTFPVKLFVCTKKGASAARNYGVKFAKNANLIFIDSDIIIQDDNLNKIKLLLKNKKIDAVNCMYTAKSKNTFLSKFQNLSIYNKYFNMGKKSQIYYNSFWTAFCAIKRKAFDDVNGFDESLLGLEDIDFGARLTNKGYKILLDKTVQNIHNNNLNFKKFFYNYYNKTKAWVKISLSKEKMKYEGYDNVRSKLSLILSNLFILSFFAIFINKMFLILPLLALSFFCLTNFSFFILAKKTYNLSFMLVSIPILLISYLFITLGIFAGIKEHFLFLISYNINLI